jgi:hypothetical protein
MDVRNAGTSWALAGHPFRRGARTPLVRRDVPSVWPRLTAPLAPWHAASATLRLSASSRCASSMREALNEQLASWT